MTDITGFGFAGHALEMAAHSKVRMRFSFATLPVYPSAVEMYAAGVDTGSNANNRQHCSGRVEIAASLSESQEEILFDPQTSGGLLISLPRGEADGLVRTLHEAGIPWAVTVGETEAGTPSMVVES